jgi:hypothetical protein
MDVFLLLFQVINRAKGFAFLSFLPFFHYDMESNLNRSLFLLRARGMSIKKSLGH